MSTAATTLPHRRFRKLLLWAALFVLVALVALVVLLLTLDANVYRPRLEREISQALGREVSTGDLSYYLSLRPTFSVRDLRIANPPWASRVDLIRAEQGEIQVDLVALWHDRLEIRRIALDGVDVLFERSADGAVNWVFAPDRPAVDADKPVRLPDIDAVALQDVRAAWRGADGQVQEARIATASATLRADRPFQAAIQGTLRDTPVRVDVAAKSSLQDALRGKPWEVTVALSGPQAQASLDASMPHPFSIEGIDLRIRLEGEKLSTLSALAGSTLPGWGPYRISSRLRYGEGAVRLDDLALLLEGLPGEPSRVEVSAGDAVFGEKVPSRVALAGKLGSADFKLDVTTAELPRLLKRDAALPVTARAMLARLTLDATGTTDLRPGGPRFDLALKAEGDALEPLRLVTKQRIGGGLPLRLSARVSGATQRYTANAIAGSVAGCTIAGDLALDAASRPRLSGTLALGRLDLAAFDLPQPQTKPAHAGAASPPSWLNAIDADVSLRIAGIAGLGIPAERLAGRVALTNGRVRIDGFTGSIARTDVTGKAALQWSGQRPWLDAQLRIPVVDAAAFDSGGSAKRPSREWIDAPLPLSSLGNLDGVAEVEVGRVVGARVPVANLAATLRLQRGRLTLSPLSAVVASVPVRGRATLDAGGEPRLTAAITADGAELAPVLAAFGQDAPVSGRLGPARFTVDARGKTPRALVANARVVARVDASTLVLGHRQQQITLDRVTVGAHSVAAVRLDAEGTLGRTSFELAASGGPLAELLDPQRAWPTITAELHATRGDQRLEVTAATGPLQRVLGRKDVPIRIDANIEGARGQLAGTIADLSRPASSPLRADVTIDSLTHLAQWLPGTRLPDLPLNGSAVVNLEPGAVSLQGMTLRAGRSDATGTLRVKWKDRTDVALDVESQLIDFAPWTARNPPSETAGPVVEDWPVPLERLRALDASVRIRARRLTGLHADLNDVTVDSTLKNGLLELSGGFAEGGTRAELRFDARDSVPQAAARIATQDLDPEALKFEGFAPASEGPRLSLQAALAGTGATSAALLRSARGEVLATAGAGKVRQVAAPYLVQDVLRSLLTVLVPGRELKEYADLECAAMRFDIRDGVASSPDGIAFRFKRMDILGSGAVNLSSREILFGFRAVRRHWLNFSPLELAGDLAQIRGTLDQPKVGLDTEGLLVKGGVAWATLGISLLATDTLRQLGKAENPCAAIAAKGKTSSDPLDALIRGLPKLPSAPAKAP